MKGLLGTPRNALSAGLVITALILIAWIVSVAIDGIGLISVLMRVLHIVAAMIWVGMIWFVNFIQLAAVQQADENARGPLMRLIVPHVTRTFLHASTVTVLSGAVLLVTTGYVLDRWVFLSVVYVSTPKALMLWGGVLAGVAMLGIAHGVIRPALRIVLGEIPADIEKIAAARERVVVFARINLILAIPVTFVMVAASHFA
jgi:uncharacterized membrane protein